MKQKSSIVNSSINWEKVVKTVLLVIMISIFILIILIIVIYGVMAAALTGHLR